MFQGASSLTLDAKGRLSVPARHRELLGEEKRLTITKHPDGCLMICPREYWKTFSARVSALPMSAHWWKRVFLGNAMDVEIDGTGRIPVSPELRQSAGIDRDTLLLGMGEYFELWDSATYAAKEAQATAAGIPEALQDFSF